jgi:NAD(P)-dependent dehydrogenase (short-subunit alcohol dehydrogenase family)
MEQSVVSPPGNQWMPMGRMVGREEVAQIVVFLMGEGTAYVTGQNLEVAGGTRL